VGQKLNLSWVGLRVASFSVYHNGIWSVLLKIAQSFSMLHGRPTIGYNLFISLTKPYLSTPHLLDKPDKRQRLFFLKSMFFSVIFKRLNG